MDPATRRRRRGFHAVHFIDQGPMVFLQARHLRFAAARGKPACQPLKQPGSERIKLPNLPHFDIDALDGIGAVRNGENFGLESGGILGNP